jgi:hypothetical protein
MAQRTSAKKAESAEYRQFIITGSFKIVWGDGVHDWRYPKPEEITAVVGLMYQIVHSSRKKSFKINTAYRKSICYLLRSVLDKWPVYVPLLITPGRCITRQFGGANWWGYPERQVKFCSMKINWSMARYRYFVMLWLRRDNCLAVFPRDIMKYIGAML